MISKLNLAKTIFVLPCSGRKNPNPSRHKGTAIDKFLPTDLAKELEKQRLHNAIKVQLDGEENTAMAVDRYDGLLYRIARTAIRSLMDKKAHVLILSGGYGLVTATEAISMYNHVFTASMWKDKIVERCLASYAKKVKATTLIAIMSVSTGYAKVMRRTTWPANITKASLITPESAGQKGMMVKGPKAQGQAILQIAKHQSLAKTWRSTDGLAMQIENLMSK